jgi:hypothetical protein
MQRLVRTEFGLQGAVLTLMPVYTLHTCWCVHHSSSLVYLSCPSSTCSGLSSCLPGRPEVSRQLWPSACRSHVHSRICGGLWLSGQAHCVLPSDCQCHRCRSHSGCLPWFFLASTFLELSVALVCSQGLVYCASANLLARASGRPVLEGSDVSFLK